MSVKNEKGCWYFTTVFDCVLGCGGETIRKRMPPPRPEKYQDRYEYESIACYGCQYGMFM